MSIHGNPSKKNYCLATRVLIKFPFKQQSLRCVLYFELILIF